MYKRPFALSPASEHDMHYSSVTSRKELGISAGRNILEASAHFFLASGTNPPLPTYISNKASPKAGSAYFSPGSAFFQSSKSGAKMPPSPVWSSAKTCVCQEQR